MPSEHHRPKHRRQPLAFIGLFALLLQAFLFVWHTHPLPFAAPGQPLALSAPVSGSPVSPAVADDNCQICLSLNHLSAAPVIAAALPLPRRGAQRLSMRAPPRVPAFTPALHPRA